MYIQPQMCVYVYVCVWMWPALMKTFYFVHVSEPLEPLNIFFYTITFIVYS